VQLGTLIIKVIMQHLWSRLPRIWGNSTLGPDSKRPRHWSDCKPGWYHGWWQLVTVAGQIVTNYCVLF